MKIPLLRAKVHENRPTNTIATSEIPKIRNFIGEQHKFTADTHPLVRARAPLPCLQRRHKNAPDSCVTVAMDPPITSQFTLSHLSPWSLHSLFMHSGAFLCGHLCKVDTHTSSLWTVSLSPKHRPGLGHYLCNQDTSLIRSARPSPPSVRNREIPLYFRVSRRVCLICLVKMWSENCNGFAELEVTGERYRSGPGTYSYTARCKTCSGIQPTTHIPYSRRD